LNNKLVTDREQLDLLYHGTDRVVRLSQHMQILIAYAEILKERDAQIGEIMTALFARVDTWLMAQQ